MSKLNTQTILIDLYDRDMNLWCQKTVDQLRSGDLQNLDIEHLIQEIEGLANRDKRELRNRLKVLLMHLLKRVYIDSLYDNRGWELTILEQRSQLEDLLEQSPSLKSYFLSVFDDVWQKALDQVKQEYTKVQFPEQCPFDRDVAFLLTKRFWQ